MHIIKNIKVWIYKFLYIPILLKVIPFLHKRAVKKASKKEKIKVAFFATHSSVWKYDEIYRLMVKHRVFDPVIFVCPVIDYGMENMLEEMRRTFKMFSDRGYNVYRTYNEKDGTYLDIKSEFSPDIVFYTNPYKGLIDNRYYITKFKKILTCYVPYAVMTTNNRNFYDLDFHNLVWKIFCETNIHKQVASEIQRIKGRNLIVTGYPGSDNLIFNRENIIDVWKIKDRNVKRIIWAPHHLMHELNKMSNFLEYSDIFLEIAYKYRSKLQIAFKPHPILRMKLNNEPGWGKEKTDEYYIKWDEMENGQYENSDYIDLFLSSDALIHDCGSFITEYLLTNKPSLFMVRNENVMEHWSKYGDRALDAHYQSRNLDQVIEFIEEVVLGENDWMKTKRLNFIKDVLLPPNQISASENILRYLEKEFNIVKR